MARIRQMLVLLRHVREERGLLLTMFLVISLTAFLGAAIPRSYSRMLDDELQYRITDAPANWRNISVTMQRETPVDDDESITERLAADGQSYLAALDPEIRQLIIEHSSLIASPPADVATLAAGPPLTRHTLQLRVQNDIEQHIELIDGRMPMVRPPALPSAIVGSQQANNEQPLPLVEVLLSQATAAELDLTVGDGMQITFPESTKQVLIQVAGIFTVPNPTANYWNADTQLQQPAVFGYGSDFGEVTEMAGLIAPAAYPALLAATDQKQWRHAWIYAIDPEQITIANYHEIAAATRRLQASLGPIDVLTPPATPVDPDPAQEIAVQTELSLVIDRFASQARATSTIIAVLTIGILAVGLVTLGLLAALVADHRRTLVGLIRGRGASAGQLVAAQLIEGVMVAVPAALVGLGVAWIVIDALANAWSIWAAGTIALCAILLMLVAARGNLLGRLARLLSERAEIGQPTSRRRLMIELLILVLAVVGIGLIRLRGLEPGTGAGGLVAVDPYLAAVPVLLAVTVGGLALRGFPLLMRVAAWVVRRSRGTVVVLGLRRVARQSPAAYLYVLAVIVATGIAIFGALVINSIERAQESFAWREVRADYRIDSTLPSVAFPADLDLSTVDGVELVAREFRTNGAAPVLVGPSEDIAPMTLVAIEANAYRTITAGSLVETVLPSTLFGHGATGASGTPAQPIPVVRSSIWPEEAGAPPESGQTMQLVIRDAHLGQTLQLTVEVVAVRERLLGIPAGSPFLIADWQAMQAAITSAQGRPVGATSIYISGADVSLADLEGEITEQMETPERRALGLSSVFGIELFSRSDLVSSLQATPLVRGLITNFRLSVALAVLYSAVAVITALALTARARTRDLSYLRVLGMANRQAVGLMLVEMIPAVLLASAVGVGLGILIANLIAPGIDLAAFAGPDTPVPIFVDWAAVGLIALSLAGLSVLAILVATAVTRRAQLGQVLRVGGNS